MGIREQPTSGVTIGEDGLPHVAGEPPAGTMAGTSTPVGDTADLADRDVTDADALARLNATTEPAQIETIRPDLGTE